MITTTERLEQFHAAVTSPKYAYTRMKVIGDVAIYVVYHNDTTSPTGVLAADAPMLYPEQYTEYLSRFPRS